LNCRPLAPQAVSRFFLPFTLESGNLLLGIHLGAVWPHRRHVRIPAVYRQFVGRVPTISPTVLSKEARLSPTLSSKLFWRALARPNYTMFTMKTDSTTGLPAFSNLQVIFLSSVIFCADLAWLPISIPFQLPSICHFIAFVLNKSMGFIWSWAIQPGSPNLFLGTGLLWQPGRDLQSGNSVTASSATGTLPFLTMPRNWDGLAQPTQSALRREAM
jgi:hypothetical protein